MRPLLSSLLILLLCNLSLTTFAIAEEDTIQSIQKERESILIKVIEYEQRLRSQADSPSLDALELAEVKLHTFRRDQATTTADKILHQTLVVKAFEKRYQIHKATFEAGHISSIDLLKFREDYLQAKQLLLELQTSSATATKP